MLAFARLSFSMSAFQLFSFCLGNFSISECLSSVFSLPSSVYPLPSPLLARRVPVPFLLFSLSACRIRAGKRAGIAHAPAWSVNGQLTSKRSSGLTFATGMFREDLKPGQVEGGKTVPPNSHRSQQKCFPVGRTPGASNRNAEPPLPP